MCRVRPGQNFKDGGPGPRCQILQVRSGGGCAKTGNTPHRRADCVLPRFLENLGGRVKMDSQQEGGYGAGTRHAFQLNGGGCIKGEDGRPTSTGERQKGTKRERDDWTSTNEQLLSTLQRRAELNLILYKRGWLPHDTHSTQAGLAEGGERKAANRCWDCCQVWHGTLLCAVRCSAGQTCGVKGGELSLFHMLNPTLPRCSSRRHLVAIGP